VFTTAARGLGGVTVKFNSGSTVRLMADDVTVLFGDDALGVSPTVTVGVAKVPGDPPTAAAWQSPTFVAVGQLKPVGKLFGVKVYPPKPGVAVGTV
jgi:hypothetical protein